MRLAVDIAGVRLKNPIMPASGTFGSGKEYAAFVDLNQLGAVVVKGVASQPWPGNPPPRIAETASGMLNSVGLQNPGAAAFLAEDLPFLKQFDTRIIVNICGRSVKDYIEAAEALSDAPVDLLELNISCPNVAEGCMAFGASCSMAEKVVGAVKRRSRQPLIVKLSPNVTDIAEIAKAAESAGADALSLINTLLGMKIDIHRRIPVLANKMGGLSGPAVKPVAVRMVYQVSQAVSVPIIGMGGVMTGEDAVEFLLAGATAVAVGTAHFHNPTAAVDVLRGLEAYLQKYGIEDVNELRDMLH